MKHARPDTLDEALTLLGRQTTGSECWQILAGGTDYYPALRDREPAGAVLDVTAINSLRSIAIENGSARIGALATWTDIVRSELPPAFNALRQAALEVGSVQIQNRATVVGNICNASPAADGVPPLLTLDASVELTSAAGVRVVSLAEFIQGNRRTLCRSDELVTSILVPESGLAGHSHFVKLGARRYLVISIAMAAARVVVDNDSKVQSAAIAIGSCSEVARRLPLAEKAVIGAGVSDPLQELICADHLAGIKPIDDIRASASYREFAALEIVKTAVAACLGQNA